MIRVPHRQKLLTAPIKTPRLALRPLDTRDISQLAEAIESSRDYLAPWLPWVASYHDQDDARRFAQASVTEWERQQAFRLGVFAKNSPKLLGVVALELVQNNHQSAELGYWLRQNVQRQGVMTEAAYGVLQTAFDHWGFHRIGVAAATSNHRSLAVIARLGFQFEGIAREAEYCAGRWLDHARFGMLARDLLEP